MELWHGVLIFAVAVGLLGTLVLAKKGYLNLSLPNGGGLGEMPDFVLNFAAIILSGAVLGFGLYEARAVWDGGGWLTRSVFYILASLAIALDLTREGTARKISLNLATTACILAGSSQGLHILLGCDAACQLQKQQAAVAQTRLNTERQLAVEAARYPGCNLRKVAYRFGTTEPSVPFNPAGQCAPDVWHDGHCLWIRQAGNTAPTKHCGGKMPPDVESAWSADTAFDGFVKLSPPRYTTLVRWRN